MQLNKRPVHSEKNTEKSITAELTRHPTYLYHPTNKPLSLTNTLSPSNVTTILSYQYTVLNRKSIKSGAVTKIHSGQ